MPLPEGSDFPPAPSGKVGWPWDSKLPGLSGLMSSGRDWPKISVVTPSYNHRQFIEEAIRSVLLQGYPNLEYIVIDGGSTDGTLEIIHKYEPWLAYWISEPDAGQGDAIRKGFQQANGDLFAWQNSDDFYQLGAFQRIAEFFLGNLEVVFANGDVNVVDEDSHLVGRIYAMRPSAFIAANYGQHGWPQQGCFWRKTAYEQVGGIDPSFQFCMDKDLFIRLVRSGHGRRIQGPPLANFRVHATAKSSLQQDVARQETARIIEKYGQLKWASRPRLMHALWWLYRKQSAIRGRLNRAFGLEY